jgi:hypothetical protein
VDFQGGLIDRPRVIIHNLMSLDGRLDGFPAGAGLYYKMAVPVAHQAVPTGSALCSRRPPARAFDLPEEDPETLPDVAATGSAAAGSIVTAPHLAASATAGTVRLIADPGSPDAVALEQAAVEQLRPWGGVPRVRALASQ